LIEPQEGRGQSCRITPFGIVAFEEYVALPEFVVGFDPI